MSTCNFRFKGSLCKHIFIQSYANHLVILLIIYLSDARWRCLPMFIYFIIYFKPFWFGFINRQNKMSCLTSEIGQQEKYHAIKCQQLKYSANNEQFKMTFKRPPRNEIHCSLHCPGLCLLFLIIHSINFTKEFPHFVKYNVNMGAWES